MLREYALLADGERGAVIGPRGEIAWMCVPRWDSGSVFSTLVGGDGVYAVTPVSRFVWGGFYEPGSLIWRSRWVTEGGLVECREALAFPARPDRAVVLRRIMALDGDARVSVVLQPRAGYDAEPLRGLSLEGGCWTGRTGSLRFRWQGAPSARPGTEGRRRSLLAELTVPEGAQHDLVLEIGEGVLDDPPVDAGTAWKTTEAAWADGVPPLSECVDADDARMSYAVLRGLTASSGGMVAAATTSLPERAETGRNYDYRYVWIRDQCYAGQAAFAVGDPFLLGEAVRFVGARLIEHGAGMAPAYTPSGEAVPDQRQLGLPGYPGGFDRIGNWVNRQFQLDAFGEALLLLSAAAEAGVLDSEGWKAAGIAASAVAARWQEPDAGIWEIDNRPWTHSRLTAAAGLRALARASPAGRSPTEWLTLADHIVADTSSRSVHRDGYWTRAPDDDGLDGALLLPPLRGAVAADDPRTEATLDAYMERLTEKGYAYRFRHRPGPLGEAEGSFLLCGFVMAMALDQVGRRQEALRWWERTKASCGPPMLYSEEFDVGERQMRGNLPQAFVHAMMLEAAARLARG